MSVNPFDPKTVFLAKHAQHVVLIHFPIALFFASVLFDFLAQRTKNASFESAAYFNSLLAAISTIPVVATGLIAWQWALEGQKLKGTLLMHLVLGILSSILMWVVWFMHRTRRNQGEVVPKYRLTVEFVAAILVALTGHLGGFLSGVNLPT